MLSETFLIIKSTNRDRIKNIYWFSYKVTVIFAGIIKLKLHQEIFENTEISNFMKIRPMGAPSCFMRVDGQTDRQRS
jgi:hypothetical protein